jgi:hypothetical protein
MKEAFSKLYPNDLGLIELAENNSDYRLDAIGARHHWAAFKAGYETAIEDAAKVCDAECNPEPYAKVSQYESGGYSTAEFLAEAIRALKEKT